MYSTFDAFLSSGTWHTRHQNDEDQFFRILNGIVREPQFNADQMAAYMRQKAGNPAFDHAISHYCVAAWAVADFLRVNGL